MITFLWSSDLTRLLIWDLEGRWRNRKAPEVSLQRTLDAGWTEQSDIFDLGHVIEGLVYATGPMTRQVEWPVPPPLDTIVQACTRNLPQDRSSLEDLHDMVSAIQVAGSGESSR